MSDYDPSKDPRSSSSLIQAYLASKGLQPTGENVRRALEANNANPGMIKNSASSLVNSLPSTEAEDQAAMAARGHGGSGLPTPPIPPGANRELPDSAGGSETRVGGTGGTGAGGGAGGGGSSTTSAAPTGGGGGVSVAPAEDELSNALIAAAIGGGTGLAANRMRQVWQNRSPSSTPVTAVEPPAAAVAAPAEPLPGPRVGTQFDAQGKPAYSGGPRGQLPPSVPATPSPAPAPSQAITPPDAFVDPELTRRLNAGTPVPGPTAEQIKANPMTASVPAAEVAPTGTRAPRARVRAPRVKIPL
jgi:hypothetical protein